MNPTDPQTAGLVAFALDVLEEARALVGQYVAAGIPGYADQVGPHLRHVIEHHEALLAPRTPGVIEYDARPRDRRLETDPQAAEAALSRLARTLRDGRFDSRAPVAVVGVAGLDGESDFATASTLGRELVFNAMHAVHHFALLRPACLAAGLSLPAGFGKAPATRRHEAQAAHSTPASLSPCQPEVPCPESRPSSSLSSPETASPAASCARRAAA